MSPTSSGLPCRKFHRNRLKLLRWSWFIYLLSILFGFWTLMAVTGSIGRLLRDKDSALIIDNIRLPAGLQIIFFLVATIFLVLYGVAALHELKKKPEPPPARQSSTD